MIPVALLGAAGADLPKHNRSFGRLPALLFSDVLLIIGVALALLLVLAGGIYAWTKWRRKRRRHVASGQKVYRHSHGGSEHTHGDEDESEDSPDQHHHHQQDEAAADDDQDQDQASSDASAKRRYKYRVRRRSHRSRNPTLAQAGGLPPVKSNQPDKPY